MPVNLPPPPALGTPGSNTNAGATGTAAGNAVAGNPVAGNPVAGNPVAGNTVAGNTVAGNTVAGNTVVGAGPGSGASGVVWNGSAAPAVVPGKISSFDPAAVSPMIAVAKAKADGPSDFDLIPGRYPNTVGLPTVLEQLGKTPEGRAAIGQMFALFAAKTGVVAPPDMVAAAQQNPKLVMQALEVTPMAMAQAVDKVNENYKAGKIKDPPPQIQRLPQKFNFANFDLIVSAPRESTIKPLAPDIFHGSVPSTTSDAQIKKNRVMAETFQRLAGNGSLPAEQQFEVTFNGKPYTKLPDFVAGLRAEGYQIESNFESRIANFAELKTLVPGSNPPKYLDVPAPLMIRTGYRDAQGKVATLPVSHSEMNINIKAGPGVTGPKLDADLKAYHGMSATGFFSANEFDTPAWLGSVKHGASSGDQTARAITVAGALTDIINSSAKAEGLYASGYGATGVCNDFNAVIEQGIQGKADQYPLLMNDSTLVAVIKAKLSDQDMSDNQVVGDIRGAIYQLPNDVKANSSAQRRALASIPWVEGQEPFQSTVDARKTLNR